MIGIQNDSGQRVADRDANIIKLSVNKITNNIFFIYSPVFLFYS